MAFQEHELPAAYSMLRVVENSQSLEPFHKFVCYWAAFNNIYVTIADRNPDLKRKFKEITNGKPDTKKISDKDIPKMEYRGERDKIKAAFKEFDADLKDSLIKHLNTKYFVERTPRWRNDEIGFDARSQKLNGVINVGDTIDSQYPVWNPINTEKYELYLSKQGDCNDEIRDELAEQILWVIYTVRNNIFHGGKMHDDRNDRNVIEKAFLLLKLIVEFFLEFDSIPSP